MFIVHFFSGEVEVASCSYNATVVCCFVLLCWVCVAYVRVV